MTAFEQHPDCWQCLLVQGDKETDRAFAVRLSLNHQWTGGEHTFPGGGRLVLPRSAYEPLTTTATTQGGGRPVRLCRHERRLCMTCTTESAAS